MVPIQAFSVDGKVVVRARGMGGKWNELALNCTPDQFLTAIAAYDSGAHIQNAFPFLDAGEREFLISGITPAEWEFIFGKEAQPT